MWIKRRAAHGRSHEGRTSPSLPPANIENNIMLMRDKQRSDGRMDVA